jgi:VanZ family protein
MLRHFDFEARFAQTSRAVGFACIVVLIVLSLLPGNERPHTGSPGQFEHAVAYFGTAAFLALGFRKTTDRVTTILLLIGLAAVLEVIQLAIPGRNSQMIDWLASSLGAGAGVLAVVLMERLRPAVE